jgi:exonuclease III
MRLVTYNANGLRALLEHHDETLASLLERLKADIVCVQETKLSGADMKNMDKLAVAAGWYESMVALSLCSRSKRLPWLIQEGDACAQLIRERRNRESFFSLNTSGQWSAHHGVATFCRTSTAEAFAAEDGLAGTRAPGAPGICADLDSKWWWRCAKPALRVCAAESVCALLHLAAPCSTLPTVPGELSA